MAETEKLEVLRPFNKTPQGDLADVGEVITVDKTRADELKRLGLAGTPKGGAKAAPATDNKMAPTPDNKSVDVAAAADRRAPRRTGTRK